MREKNDGKTTRVLPGRMLFVHKVLQKGNVIDNQSFNPFIIIKSICEKITPLYKKSNRDKID